MPSDRKRKCPWPFAQRQDREDGQLHTHAHTHTLPHSDVCLQAKSITCQVQKRKKLARAAADMTTGKVGLVHKTTNETSRVVCPSRYSESHAHSRTYRQTDFMLHSERIRSALKHKIAFKRSFVSQLPTVPEQHS